VLSVEPIAIMVRKDDPAFKKAVDTSLAALMKSGEIAKIYEKWFMQPIPPTNTRIGLAASEATRAAWANPNDKPVEDYAKK
jgi:glutamate/aspartate transport system substrate-binding protein